MYAIILWLVLIICAFYIGKICGIIDKVGVKNLSDEKIEAIKIQVHATARSDFYRDNQYQIANTASMIRTKQEMIDAREQAIVDLQKIIKDKDEKIVDLQKIIKDKALCR